MSVSRSNNGVKADKSDCYVTTMTPEPDSDPDSNTNSDGNDFDFDSDSDSKTGSDNLCRGSSTAFRLRQVLTADSDRCAFLPGEMKETRRGRSTWVHRRATSALSAAAPWATT